MHDKDFGRTAQKEREQRCRFCERVYLSEQEMEQHVEESHPEEVAQQASDIWPRLR